MSCRDYCRQGAIAVHFRQHFVLVVGQHNRHQLRRRRHFHGSSASHEQHFRIIAVTIYIVVVVAVVSIVTLFRVRDHGMYYSVNVVSVGVFIFA
jgi:hypothetical protein